MAIVLGACRPDLDAKIAPAGVAQILYPRLRRPTRLRPLDNDHLLASARLVRRRTRKHLFAADLRVAVLDGVRWLLRRLKRLASGDYRPDERPTTFPPFTAAPRRHKQSGLSPWALFEAYVDAKKPQNATINRWRAVFKDLEKHFAEREAGSIDADDAQAWAEGLRRKQAL